MMSFSYREPDERDGDRVVYFDYSKSLEARKRPLPWKDLGKLLLTRLLSFAVITAIVLLAGGELTEYRCLTLLMIPICVVGLIPLIRSNRALSADNFVELKRRAK